MDLIAQKDIELRQRLTDYLRQSGQTELAECEDWDCTLLEMIQKGNIKLLFLDLQVAGLVWQQRCKDLLATLPNTKLILTAEQVDNAAVLRCFEQGLWSFIPNSDLLKNGFEIVQLIAKGGQYFPSYLLSLAQIECQTGANKEAVLPSGERLTKRQREVLGFLQEGLSNKQIAGKMNISEPTVKLHIHGLFHKLGAMNRTQIVLKAGQLGLI